MKNKTILIIICVILGMVLVGGATYLITDNLLNKANPTETLTDKDVEEYLTYVPFQYKDNAYEHESINVNEIDKLALLGMALDKEMGSYSDVDKLLKKMYNTSLDSIKLENSDKLLETPTGACYSYNNKVFSEDDCIGGMLKISIIEDYKVNNDELIITEYAARDEKVGLVDMYSDYATDYIDGDTEEYFKQNKDEFTKYEHTFKKNDTGYYWYSTKVVKSGKTNSTALSDEELMDYLDYVPVEYLGNGNTPDDFKSYRAYEYDKININEIDKLALLIQALEISINDEVDNDTILVDKSIVEQNIKKMYNIDLNSIDLTNFNDNYNTGYIHGRCFEYRNNIFDATNACMGDLSQREHLIEKYEQKDDELYIYEYVGAFNWWGHVIYDYKNDYKYEIMPDETTGNYAPEWEKIDSTEFMKENKDKFTLYKDTFKKNDTGYYWYSTEVVK